MINKIISIFPEVKQPEGRLSFKTKLIWTSLILLGFFLLSVLPLYGLGLNALEQFEQLSIILGAKFGSIVSLGIGPIVTASIVLQLLVGSGILKIDNTTHEGRQYMHGLQKILAIFFIIFEACVFVFLGGLAPDPLLKGTSTYFAMEWILILQLFIGGIIILFMDEVVQKWGFGSGISLFIAAGVAQEIFVRAFSPLNALGQFAFGSGQAPVGAFLVFVLSLIEGVPGQAVIALASIIATIVIFMLSVYAQSMKVEIPLSFGRVRGFGVRWPLQFLYTSNIPVILVAALLANIQLWARLMQNWGLPLLGTFSGNAPASGLVKWIATPNLVHNILTGGFVWMDLVHSLIYILIMVAGAILFSVFWVQTAGMGAKTQAKNIMASGLYISGFRKDERIIEKILDRYIYPLTVMGAIAIGLLASGADLLGALSRGTGILLAVMIIYKLYEDIAKHHMYDMHPAMRKMMGGEQ